MIRRQPSSTTTDTLFPHTTLFRSNMIPPALIERVEVVTGGASAVYGSDAISGVVNFIMRKDFEGIEADAQYGLTTRGDGQKTALSLTAGTNFAEGRGNITINGTNRKEERKSVV